MNRRRMSIPGSASARGRVTRVVDTLAHRAMQIVVIAAITLFATGAIAQHRRASAPRPAAAAPAALPPGAGQAQVKAACSACHAITIITGQHYTADKWEQVVDQMVSRGAPVKDADYDIVVAYLTRNFGAKK